MTTKNERSEETARFRVTFGEHLDKLVALNAVWERLLRTGRVVGIGIIVLSVVMMTVGIGMAFHAVSIRRDMSDLMARMDTVVTTQEQLRGSQKRTEEKVEDVGVQVAEARAETPDITIVQTDAGAGTKAQAQIVLRPKPIKPLLPAMPSDAGVETPPAISIPVALPPGSKVIAEDGGVPPP